MDKLRTLCFFASASEKGSFVDAAKAFGTSPSTISKAISRLENDLQIPIYTHYLHTPPAHLILPVLEKIILLRLKGFYMSSILLKRTYVTTSIRLLVNSSSMPRFLMGAYISDHS
jgi:hypothetical protein